MLFNPPWYCNATERSFVAGIVQTETPMSARQRCRGVYATNPAGNKEQSANVITTCVRGYLAGAGEGQRSTGRLVEEACRARTGNANMRYTEVNVASGVVSAQTVLRMSK